MLSNRFDEAFIFAHKLHNTQKRKGTEIPYIAHLMSVAALVLEYGGLEDDAIAALLHDSVEDQGGPVVLEQIRVRFGDYVSTIVEDCTDAWTSPKLPWQERKQAYLSAMPKKSRSSLFVSLADKTHNAESMLSDFRSLGNVVWDRFNANRSDIIWYYSSLSNAFSEQFSNDVRAGGLADRLRRAVSEIQSN